MTRIRSFIFALTLGFFSLVTLGCDGMEVSRKGFTAVENPNQLPECGFFLLDFPIDATIHLGEKTRIVFPEDFPKDVRDDIEILTKDDMLLVASKGNSESILLGRKHQRMNLKIDVYLPSLRGLESTHASLIKVADSLKVKEFSAMASGASRIMGLVLQSDSVALSASGASQIEANVTGSEALLVLASGASHVQLVGSSLSAQVSVSGASVCNAKVFTARNTEFLISGASQASISTVDSISYSVSGASTLSYQGSPVVGSSSVTGASTVARK